MGNFLAELRRRRIYRIGAVYVVVAWGITQVLDVLSQLFALPAWIAQPAVIVLAIGLPVSLILAWVIVGAASDPDGSTDRLKATNTDWILASALVIVIGLIGYQQFAPRSPEIALTAEQTGEAANIAEEIVADIADRLPNSVAVLPFENLSPDPEDAFFALGTHDEVISQLTKLQNVNVIARSSVMEYPSSGKSVPEIADELNVEMVMSGSVRYAGDRVRVSVQLIDGATNLPTWTDEYDGDLSDIFGIQADIAMNIANSLRAEFSVAEQQSIEQPPTESPLAYEAYLKAIGIARGGISGGGSVAERRVVQSYLDEAIELDPDFALAYAWKANVYGLSLDDPVREEDWLDFRSELERLQLDYADRALAIDPDVGLAYAVRATVHLNNLRVAPALQDAEQALRLSPNEPEVIGINRTFAVLRDDFEGAIQYQKRIVALDPNTSQSHATLGFILNAAGLHQEAFTALENCSTQNPLDRGCLRNLAVAQIGLGNNAAAFDALQQVEISGGALNSFAWLVYGYGLLGQLDDAQRMFDEISVGSADDYVDPITWAWAYMGVGDYDEAFRLVNAGAENQALIQNRDFEYLIAINVWSDPMLEEPEWVELRNRLAFWRN